MHISKLDMFETKSHYHNRSKDNMALYSTERAYPVALTNKIIIKEDVIDCIYKIIDLIVDQGERIGFIKLKHSWEGYPKGQEGQTSYYTDLHAKIISQIRQVTNEVGKDNYIHYEKWQDKDAGFFYVLFVNPHSNEEDIEYLKEFAAELEDRPSTFKSSEAQELLNALISYFIKIAMVHDLNISKSAIANGHVNLNNRMHFLVKTTNSRDKETNKKCVLYHSLLPKVWVSTHKEIVTTLTYQRFKSVEHNSEIKESDRIDVFIPDTNPKSYGKFKEMNNNDAYCLVKTSALEGKRELSYINFSAIDQSIISYETAFTMLIERICNGAGIDYERVLFDPTLKGRPFVRTMLSTALGVKPKLTIIDATNPYRAKLSDTSSVNLKNKTSVNNEVKTKTGLEYTFDFINQDCIDVVVDYLIDNLVDDYEVDLVKFADIKYEDLEQDVNYLVLQDPSPTGYWHFANKEKEDALIEAYGVNWQDRVDLSFTDDDIKIDRESDFFKILRKRDSEKAKGNEAEFFTDPYTQFKLKQYDAAKAGHRKISLQGLHMPFYRTVANSYIAKTKYSLDKRVDAELKVAYKDNILEAELRPAIQKICIDLDIKRALTVTGVIGLINGNNEVVDYSDYAGEYRCFYIAKPSNKGRGADSFYASQIDLTVSKEGIEILGIKLLDNPSSVRSDERFCIPETVIPYLYNDAFYLVDDKGNVLTSYSNKREERVLSSIPQSGLYKGWTLDYYVAWHQEQKGFEIGSNITLSRTKTKPKDRVEPFLCDQSLLTPFYTLYSEVNHYSFKQDLKGCSKKKLGGSEWLFIKELDTGELLTYITDKHGAAEKKSKADKVYKILVKDNKGNTINAGSSKLALLYIQTCTFHVARVNSFSSKSILNSMAKIALKD